MFARAQRASINDRYPQDRVLDPVLRDALHNLVHLLSIKEFPEGVTSQLATR